MAKLCGFKLEFGIKLLGYILTGTCLLFVVVNINVLLNYHQIFGNVPLLINPEILYTIWNGYFLWTTFMTSALGAVFSYMLVMAVNNRNRFFILPWLVSVAISLAIYISNSPIVVMCFVTCFPFAFVYYICNRLYCMYHVLKTEELEAIEFHARKVVISPQIDNGQMDSVIVSN